jgi:Protein of unknown function (DUF1579)
MTSATTASDFFRHFIGRWTYALRTAEDSEHPGETVAGNEVVRALGEHFVLVETRGVSGDGSPSDSAALIGFDPDSGRFTGATAGTAAPALFVYRGGLSDDGRTLVLETEGPAMTKGNEIDRYRDVFRLVDQDRRQTAMEVFQDGEWKEFMRTEYVRA